MSRMREAFVTPMTSMLSTGLPARQVRQPRRVPVSKAAVGGFSALAGVEYFIEKSTNL